MSIDDPGVMDEILRRSDPIHGGTTELNPGDVVAKTLEEIVSLRSTSDGP